VNEPVNQPGVHESTVTRRRRKRGRRMEREREREDVICILSEISLFVSM